MKDLKNLAWVFVGLVGLFIGLTGRSVEYQLDGLAVEEVEAGERLTAGAAGLVCLAMGAIPLLQGRGRQESTVRGSFPIDVVADLVPLLGRPPDAKTATQLAALMSGPREDARSGPGLSWRWKASGVSVSFFRGDSLDEFQIYAIPTPAYPAFKGTLMQGLAADARRREIRAALGAPTAQATPEEIWCDAAEYFHDESEPHMTGYTHHSDRYERPGYELGFHYDWTGEPKSGHHVGREPWPGDADELRAMMVGVKRPGAKLPTPGRD